MNTTLFKIVRINQARGYAFARRMGDDANYFFVHVTDSTFPIEHLVVGQWVTGDVKDTSKGKRLVNVSLACVPDVADAAMQQGRDV